MIFLSDSESASYQPPGACETTIGLNTLRPRQNGWHFTDDILKCIFFNENVWSSIKISMKFVPWGPINNIPALVQIMAWCQFIKSYILSLWSYLMQIGIILICSSQSTSPKLLSRNYNWIPVIKNIIKKFLRWKCSPRTAAAKQAKIISVQDKIIRYKKLQGNSTKNW